VFLILVLVVLLAVPGYLWWRLIKPATHPGSRARRLLTWALIGLTALLPATMIGGRVLGIEAERVLAWPGYLWLAVMFYLFVFSLALEVPRAVAAVLIRRSRAKAAPGRAAPEAGAAARPAEGERESAAAAGNPAGPATATGTAVRDPAPPAPEAGGIDRRMFLSRTASALVGVGALATVGYGMRTALGDPVIERVPIRLDRLDPRLAGLRIATVSDIHLGPLTGIGHTRRIVRMINELEADVVAIVGDLVDGTVQELGHLAAPLRHLESRYGAYFVTGNHEYYSGEGPQEWIEELRSLGVRPLRNERVEISHAGAALDLAGVNDVTGGSSGDGPDLARALGGRDPSRPVVLLAHQPILVHQAAAHGVDLQLSGHTHGGQLAPFNLLVPLQQPVVAGLASFPRAGGGRTQVYVTRGAGAWGPPVRVGAPPEITLIELRAG